MLLTIHVLHGMQGSCDCHLCSKNMFLKIPRALPQVGSHCSDLQELIGGQPWILVRVPAKADASADEAKLSGVDKVHHTSITLHTTLDRNE